VHRPDNEEDDISKKKKKLASRMKVAELKEHCVRPEVVEAGAYSRSHFSST
jgi:hypothetical protein